MDTIKMDITNEEQREKILQLKEERNAIILAHNYQIDEVQEIADYTGDSFGLSMVAARTDAEVIIFCGVRFMAESAAVLAPEKQIILPAKAAGCPLADTITAEELRSFKKKYPAAAVVSYVNTTAAVKAESDICVTSSNALNVVESLSNEEILFVPDRNLAHFVSCRTKKRIIPWDGFCITHERVQIHDLIKARDAHPDALVIVHPECPPEVVKSADQVLSTGGMLKYVRCSKKQKFIIGTEMGLLYRLKKENPQKEFYLLSPVLICPNMKYTTLRKILAALENLETLITVDPEVQEKAALALQRMLEVPAASA